MEVAQQIFLTQISMGALTVVPLSTQYQEMLSILVGPRAHPKIVSLVPSLR